MQRNQLITIPEIQMNGNIALTGQVLEAALKDPQNPLSKDLANDTENDFLAKEARHKAQMIANNQRQLRLKIERLDEQLAKNRKTLNEQYNRAIEAYYKQLELGIKNAELLLLTHTSTSSIYHAALQSLANLAELLTAVQTELVELHDERETLLQSYADNRRAAAEALFQKMDPNFAHTVGNDKINKYYINPDLVPADKQAELKEIKDEVFNRLANPETTQQIMSRRDITDAARIHYDLNGQSDRASLQIEMGKELSIVRMISFILVESNQIKTGVHVNRVATSIGGDIFSSISSYQRMAIEMEKALYQNNVNTLFMLQQQALMQTRISNILDTVSSYSKHDNAHRNAINILAEINDFKRDMSEHTAVMRGLLR